MNERSDFRDYTRLLYEVISSKQGARDWQRSKELFHPDARMVRTGLGDDGLPFTRVMSVDDYAENAESLLGCDSFSETELSHDAQIFGNVAQCASVYEFEWRSDEGTRKGRGVNFLTLIRKDNRWQIMSIVWDNERAGVSVEALALAGA